MHEGEGRGAGGAGDAGTTPADVAAVAQPVSLPGSDGPRSGLPHRPAAHAASRCVPHPPHLTRRPLPVHTAVHVAPPAHEIACSVHCSGMRRGGGGGGGGFHRLSFVECLGQ